MRQPGAVQQLDGLPAFEAEELFDGDAVENGDRESAEFLDDARNMKQPMGLWEQGGSFLTPHTLPHSCAKGLFSG